MYYLDFHNMAKAKAQVPCLEQINTDHTTTFPEGVIYIPVFGHSSPA